MIERENAINFLKKLSNDLAHNLKEMKLDFLQEPPTSNIKERLLSYKHKHQDSLNNCISQLKGDQQQFSFKDFLDKATENFMNDGEFMDLLKHTNTQIDNLKEFIRQNLEKDPNIYNIKDL